MYRFLLVFLSSITLFSSTATADNGLVTIKSSHDVKATVSRLEKVLGNDTIITRE